MRKSFALVLILLLTASSLIMVKPSFASITKPSVPEFNIKFVDASYNVTTTDPYTGINVTQQFDNNTIEVMIKNQPFAYSINGLTYHLYYNVRTKPHFVGNWTELYPIVERLSSAYNSSGNSYSEYISNNSPPESTSEYTVLSFSADYPPNAQVDFQVEAIIGHASQAWVIQHPFAPEYGGYYEPAIAFDEISGWSNTQTVTISTSGASPSPSSSPASTPTSSPSSMPSQNPTATQPGAQTTTLLGLDWTTIALIVLSIVVALLIVVIAFMRRRRVK
jgi:hypothetical protein